MTLILQERSSRAESSLAGLSVGDAFGDRFFLVVNRDVSAETGVPPAPWTWSDDTEMACSVTDALNHYGQIDPSRAGERVPPREVIGSALEAIEAGPDRTAMGEYVRRGLERSLGLASRTPEEAAHELGNGSRISGQDTVPFALWAAATRLDDYESAVRACVMVGGDMDTTAAISGGVVAAHLGREGIPASWLEAREPLPAWFDG